MERKCSCSFKCLGWALKVPRKERTTLKLVDDTLTGQKSGQITFTATKSFLMKAKVFFTFSDITFSVSDQSIGSKVVAAEKFHGYKNSIGRCCYHLLLLVSIIVPMCRVYNQTTVPRQLLRVYVFSHIIKSSKILPLI